MILELCPGNLNSRQAAQRHHVRAHRGERARLRPLRHPALFPLLPPSPEGGSGLLRTVVWRNLRGFSRCNSILLFPPPLRTTINCRLPQGYFTFDRNSVLCRSASYLYSVDVQPVFFPLADYPSLRFPLGSPAAGFPAAEADKNKRRMLFFLGFRTN